MNKVSTLGIGNTYSGISDTTHLYREKPITQVVRNGLKGDVISRKSTTDTFLLLNMERGDHTHSYYDRGLMAHSKIDMISIIGRYCM